MPFEITIPRLGWSMEVGTFVRWLKKDGESVRAGDPIFELEGEKAAQDIEAVDGGILRIPSNAPQPGTVVAVGAVIGFLVAEGETAPAIPSGNPGSSTLNETVKTAPLPFPLPSAATKATAPGISITQENPPAAPSVRRLAREMGLKLSSLEGSGPAGRITASDVRTNTAASAPETGNTTIASPRARRVANELGIDWHRIHGSGRDGRVREQDIRKAALNAQSASGSVPIPASSRRRTIANRMLISCQQTAPVTITTKVDATNLVSLRNQFKQSGSTTAIPSYSDIVMKLVTLVLRDHPMLAAWNEGEQWAIPATADDLHMGFAVDTDDGLVVPVIRGAGTMGLFEIAKQSAALIEKSRSGQLSNSEMQGGVFTITNLGAFGIDAFTPIINLPETAVLGLGRIRREPTVVDEQIVARDQITLSLTFDHRIVDGAPAARFLQSVGEAIESPSAWLLRGDV